MRICLCNQGRDLRSDALWILCQTRSATSELALGKRFLSLGRAREEEMTLRRGILAWGLSSAHLNEVRMQTKQPCVCGRGYWPNQAWQHEGCATNASNRIASNANASNGVARATNRNGDFRELECGREGGGIALSSEHKLRKSVETVEPRQGSVGLKQRWSREAYNAYQREYMRKRRGLV